MIAFLKFLQFCFRIIFFAPAGIALSFMYFAGWLTQAIAKKTRLRKTVIENVKMVLPESDAEQIADKLIENTGYSIFEILCLPFFKEKHRKAIIACTGIENLDQALKQRRGAIMITMHTGNYELFPLALADGNYKMNAILRATNVAIFEIINRSRKASGIQLINVLEKDMYKETIKLLGKNEIILTLADTGALESRYILHPFLGKKVPVATGWLTLAQRSKAPLIPVLIKKEGPKNIISIAEPIKITQKNREESMQKVGKFFEDFISQNPEQWAIFLNSYETQRMIKGE